MDDFAKWSLLTCWIDVFAMLKYCYQHDEWRNTEEVLGARPGGE